MFGSRSATRVRQPPPPRRADRLSEIRRARSRLAPRTRPVCLRLAPPLEPAVCFQKCSRAQTSAVPRRCFLTRSASSPDPFEALGVLLPAPHVDVGVAGDRLCDFFIEGA